MTDKFEPSGFLYVPDVEPEHRCQPPEVTKFGPAGSSGVPTVTSLPVGSKFFCECGKVRVVYWKPAEQFGNVRIVGGLAWRAETRRERRRRLGLRWWQRERT
jgi:hypothetical protein